MTETPDPETLASLAALADALQELAAAIRDLTALARTLAGQPDPDNRWGFGDEP